MSRGVRLLALGVSAGVRSLAGVRVVLVWAAVRVMELDRDWKGTLQAYVREVEDGLRQEGIALRPRGAAEGDDLALEQRYRPRLVVRRVHLMSPGFAFQCAVEALLGTGLPKYQHFERQAWAYRETLRAFIRGRDAADPESPHLLFLPGICRRSRWRDGRSRAFRRSGCR